MKCFLLFSLFICASLLSACQSSQDNSANNHDVDHTSLYFDSHFIKPTTLTIESAQEIFQLDAAMTNLVDKHLRNGRDVNFKVNTLITQIFAKEHIALSYSTDANVTAKQAFHSKKANCLSLTIMAYSLATNAGLDVDFQKVKVPEYWVRNGEYNMLTGHVNLLVKNNSNKNRKIIWGGDDIQIDFDPTVVKQSFPRKTINKNTVLAMFYNNKGADALINKDYNVAYHYFKAATSQDVTFSAAWGNLAIVYRIANHLDLAERTYNYAINADKNNFTAMTNLALLYRLQNKINAAEIIEDKLHHERINNPYYHALLADEARYDHDYYQAIAHYKKAIKLNGKVHDFHFRLAKVYYQLNKINLAKRALQTALRLNHLPETENQYIAKLNFLKQAESQH